MTSAKSFPQSAARLALIAPLLVLALNMFGRDAVAGSGISQDIVVYLSVTFLVLGVAFGIYSLFHWRKYSGILIPALSGLLMSGIIGYVAYTAFEESRSGRTYFEVSSLMVTDELSYRQTVLGRILAAAPVDRIIQAITNGITVNCPRCKVLNAKVLQPVPEEVMAMFDGRNGRFTTIFVDGVNSAIGDMRLYFPLLDPQPSCQDLVTFVEQKRQAYGDNATVRCIDGDPSGESSRG